MLHHVSLEIPPDAAPRSAEFWGLLGFEPVDAPPEIADYVSWFERGGTQIHLIPTPTPTVPAIGHPAIVAADFDAALDRLRAAGFEVERVRELWGRAAGGGDRAGRSPGRADGGAACSLASRRGAPAAPAGPGRAVP